ncbi:MAG TPA: RNA polymerase subunit sigma-70 [Polyangiaceae bacterium]|jgi:RNA polymerase sigma-70 factor (ECF subfamily)
MTHASPDAEFLQLVQPHERALRLHCYRMLGSSHDSDDVMQETLVRAWRSRSSLDVSAMLRPWLYRIATNVCLDELKNRKQRPLPSSAVPPSDGSTGPAPANPEATWLEPCPDAWMEGTAVDPGAAYELKESVALAFVAALQCLSAQQRAVLLLRDVVGMPADETAEALGMTVAAANSTLHRARAAARERTGGREGDELARAPAEVDEDLLKRYVAAWGAMDLDAFVSLLHDDVVLTMPPSPTWTRGKAATAAFYGTHAFVTLRGHALDLVPVGSNGQPAVAFYVDGALRAIHVVRIWQGRVVEAHHFMGRDCLAAFGLPETLPPGKGPS